MYSEAGPRVPVRHAAEMPRADFPNSPHAPLGHRWGWQYSGFQGSPNIGRKAVPLRTLVLLITIVG